MGQLVFQATLGGQVNLVGPNTASTFNINVPAVAGNMVTTGDTGTVTSTMLATSVYTAPGTIGSGTPNTGAFTTLAASSTVTLSGGTANGVSYLNGSKVLTTGSALVFDGTQLGIGASPTYPLLVKKAASSSDNSTVSIVSGTAGYAQILLGDTVSDAVGYVAYNNSANSLEFATNGAERARIDSSGNLLIGTTSASLTNTNSQMFGGGANNYSIFSHINGTSSGAVYHYFAYNGSSIGSITQNGTTGVLYNLTSDYRLKNNQQPLTGAKEFVMALQPKKWQWWDGSGEGVGFVAHEFMEVAKYSGQGEKDAVDADGKPIYQSIQPSSSEVMAYLVAHIQNLETRLAALEA